MPYILSPIIHNELPGLWGEGTPYSSEVIYDINSNNPEIPPVNYDLHCIKPHSIPHIDFPKHIIPEGETAESYFKAGFRGFYGRTIVLRLKSNSWSEENGSELKVWRFSKAELAEALERVTGSDLPTERVFITPDDVPYTENNFHDPSYIFVPGLDAAEYLVSNPKFCAYGTSWKSSDYEPGSRERPVHKILLRQAVLFECLMLRDVPEGEYFLSGFPLPIANASESPLIPVLYNKEELSY